MSDTIYTPDCWEIVKITNKDGVSHYRVLAGWYGGYAGSDSWKLSSGITSVEEEKYLYTFPQYSGSTYVCHKQYRRCSSVMMNVLLNIKANGTLIDIVKDNPLELKYD